LEPNSSQRENVRDVKKKMTKKQQDKKGGFAPRKGQIQQIKFPRKPIGFERGEKSKGTGTRLITRGLKRSDSQEERGRGKIEGKNLIEH